MQITRRIGSFRLLLFAADIMIVLFGASCSSRQKGYSVSLQKKDSNENQTSNPAVIYDDDEFFDLIQKS